MPDLSWKAQGRPLLASFPTSKPRRRRNCGFSALNAWKLTPDSRADTTPTPLGRYINQSAVEIKIEHRGQDGAKEDKMFMKKGHDEL